MAVPVWESFETASHNGTWTVTAPSVVNQNDLLLTYLLADATQTAATGSATGEPTIPSGWTQLHGGVARSAGGDCSGYMYYRVAGPSDGGASWTWTFTTPPDGGSFCIRISGNDPAASINASSFQITSSGQTQIVLPGVTTDTNDCLLVACVGVDESSAGLNPYWSDPPITGWTARYGTASTPNADTASNTYLGLCSTPFVTAGATGDQTATIAVENDAIVGFLIAVAPGAGAPTPVITDAGDETFTDGETGVVVTGTDFESPQGTGTIELGDAATYGASNLVAQTVTSWSDTSITITVELGAQPAGSKWLYVTNDSGGVSAGYPVTVNAAGVFTPQLGTFRWYSDATPDGSMSPLAAENATPTLTTAQMQNGLIRLRAQIFEAGGAGGSGTLTLEWSADGGTSWIVVERAYPNQLQEGSWFRYGAGAATEGATIGSQLLTGTNESGIYYEDNDQTVAVTSDATHELDVAVYVHWPTCDTDVQFRLLIDGTPIGAGGTPIELTTSTAADRTLTIRRLEPDTAGARNHETRFSPWPRFFHDGTRWWAFTSRLTDIEYQYWDGPGNDWSAVSTIAMTGSMEGTLHAPAFDGTDTVYIINRASSSTLRFRRGVISGTSITWDAEQSLAQTSDRFAHISVDDGGYLWIAGITASTGIWVRRSTNPDDVTAWQAVDNVASTGVASGDIISVVGLASNRCLVLWYESGTADLLSVVVNGPGSPGTVRTISTAIFSDDWGMARDTGNGLVYAAHSVGPTEGGQRKLSVLDETGDTWAACPDPPEDGTNTGSNDGLPVSVHGDDVYYFGVFGPDPEGGQDRTFEYRIYHGPGASGSWEGGNRVILAPAARVNLDLSNASTQSAGGVILTGSVAGDPGVNDRFVPYSWEYYTITVGAASDTDDMVGLLATLV